jgi:hypothetical protein
MEDYQVRQTMNKGNKPRLKLMIRSQRKVELPIRIDNEQRDLQFYVKNLGNVTAKSCVFNLYIPQELEVKHQGYWELVRMPRYHHFRLSMTRNEQSLLTEPRLHPGQEMSISESSNRDRIVLILDDAYAGLEEMYTGKYEFFAENMPPVGGRIEFIFKESFSILQVENTNR